MNDHADRVFLMAISQAGGAVLHGLATLSADKLPNGQKLGGLLMIVGHVLKCTTPAVANLDNIIQDIVAILHDNDDVIQWMWASRTFLRLQGIRTTVTLLRQEGDKDHPHGEVNASIHKWIVEKVGPYRLVNLLGNPQATPPAEAVPTIAVQLAKYEEQDREARKNRLEEIGRNAILEYVDRCDKVTTRSAMASSPAGNVELYNDKDQMEDEGKPTWRIYTSKSDVLDPQDMAVAAFNDLLPAGTNDKLEYMGQIYKCLLGQLQPGGEPEFTIKQFWGWFQVDPDGE